MTNHAPFFWCLFWCGALYFAWLKAQRELHAARHREWCERVADYMNCTGMTWNDVRTWWREYAGTDQFQMQQAHETIRIEAKQ